MKTERLLYISRNRIPSLKANCYQTLKTSEALSLFYRDFELWVPAGYNPDNNGLDPVTSIFGQYNVRSHFPIKFIKIIDTKLLHDLNQRVWFLLSVTSFCAAVCWLLLRSRDRSITIFSRDRYVIFTIGLLNSFLTRKFRLVFEAHGFSDGNVVCARKASAVVVLNEQLRQKYLAHGVSSVVCHDAVDLETFTPQDKHQARLELGLPLNANIFCYAGRFQTLGESKGLETLVRSLKYLSGEFFLLAVGEVADDGAALRKLAADLSIPEERICFAPRVDVGNLVKYLAAADVLTMPFPNTTHYSQNMSPLKMFEYMAMERPIVASDLPSIREVLTTDDHCIYCVPNDPRDFARGIEEALGSRGEVISLVCSKEVKKYSWEQRAKRIIDKVINSV